METSGWLVVVGTRLTVTVTVVVAAVVAVGMAGSRHAVQCSWVAAAAYHPFAVCSHNAQQFVLLRQVTKDHASVPTIVQLVPIQLRSDTTPRCLTRRCTLANICEKQMYSQPPSSLRHTY